MQRFQLRVFSFGLQPRTLPIVLLSLGRCPYQAAIACLLSRIVVAALWGFVCNRDGHNSFALQIGDLTYALGFCYRNRTCRPNDVALCCHAHLAQSLSVSQISGLLSQVSASPQFPEIARSRRRLETRRDRRTVINGAAWRSGEHTTRNVGGL